MPGYYRKNIVRNAQRKFLRRKEQERKEKLDNEPGAVENEENKE